VGELHEHGLPQRAVRLRRRGRQVIVLTFNGDGKLVAFDTLADETAPNRVFAKEPTSPWAPTHLAGPRPSARDRIQADMIGALGSDASDDAGLLRRDSTVVRVCSPPTGGASAQLNRRTRTTARNACAVLRTSRGDSGISVRSRPERLRRP